MVRNRCGNSIGLRGPESREPADPPSSVLCETVRYWPAGWKNSVCKTGPARGFARDGRGYHR